MCVINFLKQFRNYLKGYLMQYFSHAALLLLYDVTNKTSFDNIRAWLGEIREYAQDDVVIMLLGNIVTTLRNLVPIL